MTEAGGRKLITSNRRALHDYEILETVEAGLVLLGPEVKSLREGRANLSDSYAVLRGGEAFLLNAHVSPYDKAGRDNPEPRRERKLLLHRRELSRLKPKLAERGFTQVPLSLYFKDGRAKVEIAVAKGKRQYDKRQALRERQDNRDAQRALHTRGER